MSNTQIAAISFALWALFFGLACIPNTQSSMSIQTSAFGTTKEGKSVTQYMLSNANGMTVGILNYGGIITHLKVPDRKGYVQDVVLGHNNIKGYEEENDYFGCIAGRYANRIQGGTFSLDGNTYQLPKNNGPNALHGGLKGFDQQIWDAIPYSANDSVGLVLSYTSPDGEEGYPGTLRTTVTYTLTQQNELRIHYEAVTDKPTILNLTNHSYFNLKDGGASDILDHELQIYASRFTPVGKTLIPTGSLDSVQNTPFDFTKATPIGQRINTNHIQLEYGQGYDHNYVLDQIGDQLMLAAQVRDPGSGRVLEVWTTEPGIQFYSGNFLKGDITGKQDIVYKHRAGFCLETQHFPDSPNQPDFPTTVLRPGETFESTTLFRFKVD